MGPSRTITDDMRSRILLSPVLLICLGAVIWTKGVNMTQATEVHPHHGALVNADGTWKYTNALVDQTSPYLLQHAHNPVDWYPWGEQAFEKARRENKPIFLSIGYSTCYWCHVMERQVFENPAIAEQMNEQFVNIKVDREERPDVDDIYMTATQLMTQHGGWPMSVFLTPPGTAGQNDPGLKPFFAGTYFPPEASGGLPGFPDVIKALNRAWLDQREDVVEQSDKLAEAVQQVLVQREDAGPVGIASVQATTKQLLNSYDQTHGGFGGEPGRPKFPQPTQLQFMLAVHGNNPDLSVWEVIAHSLDRMARGGMYDQVGGGFHRYSTDEKWLVPHFEKMLYDNGQLLSLYAASWERFGRRTEPAAPDAKPAGEDSPWHGAWRQAQCERIIRETCAYVFREMLDATGAFWSAQDAESNAREGESYVWTRAQIEAAVPDPALAAFALNLYGLDQGTNFKDPHHPDAAPVNVLYLPRPLAEIGDAAAEQRRQVNAQLKSVRDGRDQPGTDDKIITSWNGLMIAGLADAGRVLGENAYVDAAARAADAIIAHMALDGSAGGLYRTMRQGKVKIPGFLEDYAFFARGLLALERAGVGGGKYLEAARRHVAYAKEHFGAPGGGYYDTLEDQADLFVRKRGYYDGAVPSGNSVMVHNLIDLFELTQDVSYLNRATEDLRSFASRLDGQASALVHMQHALLRCLEAAPSDVKAQLAAGPSEPPPAPRGPVQVDVQREGDALRFSLGSVHPIGASIDAVSGTFSWQPDRGQRPAVLRSLHPSRPVRGSP